MKISNIINTIILCFVVIMTPVVSHAMNSSEREALCRQYAVEDQISQDELAEYLEECIQENTSTEGELIPADQQDNKD